MVEGYTQMTLLVQKNLEGKIHYVELIDSMNQVLITDFPAVLNQENVLTFLFLYAHGLIR